VVARLVDGLEPVRPIRPLRLQIASIALVWTATGAIAASVLDFHPFDAAHSSGVSSSFVAVLAVVGFSGLVMGLAGRIPGRERVMAAAGIAIALGLAITALLGGWLPGSLADAGSLAQCLDCSGRSILLAIPSGVVAVSTALRSVGWHAARTGFGLAIGSASLGALLVHMSCASESPWHWLIAHAALPLTIGSAFGVLVAWILSAAARRWKREADADA
jgi:MFS family permease